METGATMTPLTKLDPTRKTTLSQERGDFVRSRVIGQNDAIDPILRRLDYYNAGLNDTTRPIGVFLLLGPTGTGKTLTVEAIAEAIHGTKTGNVLKINCGEYQMDHEVAKLIGAPPGYLGHRETQPMLSQQKVTSVTSDRSGVSVILFDEIEKAAGSLSRILLGVFDKGTLTLGDNAKVDFTRSLIFLTSNLGTEAMMKEINPNFGFATAPSEAITSRLRDIGVAAVKRKFSAEFVNRIDSILTYSPLTDLDLRLILTQELNQIQSRIISKGSTFVTLIYAPEVLEYFITHGTSREYGARHLKRLLNNKILDPLGALLGTGQIPTGSVVTVELHTGEEDLSFYITGSTEIPIPVPEKVVKMTKRKSEVLGLER